jgi:hypothetical protein
MRAERMTDSNATRAAILLRGRMACGETMEQAMEAVLDQFGFPGASRERLTEIVREELTEANGTAFGTDAVVEAICREQLGASGRCGPESP